MAGRARAISDSGWVVGSGLFDTDGAGGPGSGAGTTVESVGGADAMAAFLDAVAAKLN